MRSAFTVFILLLLNTEIYASEKCSYTGTALNFETSPGKVCVNTISPQYKPQYLEFVTEENRERLDAKRSEVGTAIVVGDIPVECLMEFTMMIDPKAYKMHCYQVMELQSFKKLWEEARSKQEIGAEFAEFYKLESNNPDWAGFVKRLKEITQTSRDKNNVARDASR